VRKNIRLKANLFEGGQQDGRAFIYLIIGRIRSCEDACREW
jgi:hypothetical protein